MSSSNESNNPNLFKYITIALVAVILIGGGIWYVTSSNSKQAATEAALSAAKAEIAAQKTKDAANLALKGQKSAKVYDEYMKQALTSRFIASNFRKKAEAIQTALRKNPQFRSSSSFDIRQVIGLSAQYYDNAASLGLNVDFKDIDSDLIEYISKNRELDLELKKLYEDYSATGNKPDEELGSLTSRRNQLIDKNEQALINKFNSIYGIQLSSSKEMLKDVQKNLTAASNSFASTLTPSHVAQQLIGKVFTNADNNQQWRLSSSEYFDGSFALRNASDGIVVVGVDLQVRNLKTNNTGKLSALVVYAKPASESMLEWPIIWSICP